MELWADAAHGNWGKKMSEKEITVRASGKCHPAIQFKNGDIMVVCNCPGSKNGRLAAAAIKIADGHANVNCRKH